MTIPPKYCNVLLNFEIWGFSTHLSLPIRATFGTLELTLIIRFDASVFRVGLFCRRMGET